MSDTKFRFAFSTGQCQSVMTRRDFLRLGVTAAALAAFGCKPPYSRPAAELNLGPVKDLLSTKQHIAKRKILVIRDDNGWAALSTSCNYEGCDLTFQDETLLCPCCRSLYDHSGHLLRGPSKSSLSWYEVTYRDGSLWANSGKPVEEKARFTTPQLEAALKKLREKLQENPNLLQDGTVPKIIRELPEKQFGNMGDAQYERERSGQ